MAVFAELAAALQKALKSQQMYGETHPRAQGDLDSAHQLLSDWLTRQAVLQVTASETRLLVDGAPVNASTVHTLALHRQLGERGLSGFMFLQGLRPDEIRTLLQLLILRPVRIQEAGGAAAFLEAQGASHLRLSQSRYLEVREDEEVRQASSEAEKAVDDEEVPPPRQPEEARALPASASTAAASPAQAPALPGAPANLVTLVKDALRSTFAEKSASESSGSIQIPRPVADAVEGEPETALAAPALAESSPEEAEAGPLRGFAGAGMGSVLNIIPAYLGDLGPMGYNIGLGEGMPTVAQMAVLRSALESLAPESQLSMLAGLPTLPAKPQGLALGIKELAGEILGMATVGLMKRNVPWAHLQGVLQSILRPLSEREAMVRSLAIHMRESNLDGDLAEALLRHVQWEGMSIEARVVQVLEEGQLWTISLEQRLAFLRDLLDKGRHDAFLRVLQLVFDVQLAEDAAVRLVAAQTLRGVGHWAADPGLPAESEAALASKLQAHFAWEPSEPIHLHSSEGLLNLLPIWVDRGTLAEVQDFVDQLGGLSAMQGGAEPWRDWALADLKARLCAPDLLGKAYAQLFLPDRDRVNAVSLPYFQWLGVDAMRYLVVALGQEKDRHWRGRLLELLRAAGPLAVPPLLEALDSPTWFLVRNALNVLAEVGKADCAERIAPHLRHVDGRVRRTAVRALWKLQGPECAAALAPLLSEPDPETQMEILFGLGQARAAGAAQAVLDLALERKAPEKLRLRAFDTLPLLGSEPPIGPLSELFKRKKGLFAAPESFEIRLAAARSLRGIGTPEARWALQKALELEPKGRERDALDQVLASFGRA